MSGHQYPEFWGKVHFWMTFIGVNLTFFPHALPRPRRHAAALSRLSGRLRRLELSSPRSAPSSRAASTLFFVFVVFRTFTSKERVGAQLLGRGRDDAGMDRVLAAAVPHLRGAAAHPLDGA